MKCEEARQWLTLLLDGELSPAEQAQLQVHLSECSDCRAEYLSLQDTMSRVRRTLHSRAEQVEAPAAAWHQLQARLASEIPISGVERSPLMQFLGALGNLFTGGGSMRKGVVWLILVTLIAAAGVIFAVPSVRAQIGEVLRWFRFESPAGGGEVAVPGNAGFTPLRPTYLPAGFQAMAVGFNPESASLNYWNSATQQVLIIDQTLVGADQEAQLPAGKKVKVKGVPAVFVSGVQREVSFVQLPPTPEASPEAEGGSIEPLASTSERITVKNGTYLIWFTNGIRFEVFSNLPEKEILKVVESLEPAEELLETITK